MQPIHPTSFASILKKVEAYSILAAAFTVCAKQSQAQIIYHDIVPDTILGLGDQYNLDLNGDKKEEYTVEGGGIIGQCGEYYAPRVRGAIWQTPFGFSHNQLGAVSAFSVFYYSLAIGLGYGENIAYKPANFQWSTGAKMTYLNNYECKRYGSWGSDQMPVIRNKFLPLRFTADSGKTFNYGWLRLSFDEEKKVIVHDYAYNAIPGQSIRAGEGIGHCVDAFEPNNSFDNATYFRRAYYVPDYRNFQALIDNPDDTDIFNFYISPTMNATLYNLPADYDLQLFDSNHKLVATSANAGLKTERISFNHFQSGWYYLKVYGKNHAFDSTSCYTLEIGTSVITEDADAVKVPISDLTISPNPSAQNFEVKLPNVGSSKTIIYIYDISGRNMTSLCKARMDSDHLLLDASSLSDGIYFLMIQTDSKDYIAKLIKKS